jgi:hypothetical protein
MRKAGSSSRNSRKPCPSLGGLSPSKVPGATSSTHVVYDYECPDSYPVKWAAHNGGHTDLAKDPGQSTSWAIELSWKFITQF